MCRSAKSCIDQITEINETQIDPSLLGYHTHHTTQMTSSIELHAKFAMNLHGRDIEYFTLLVTSICSVL